MFLSERNQQLCTVRCASDQITVQVNPAGYCTVLYCTVLYCTVLYCTVLYCTVLYCTVLYCTEGLLVSLQVVIYGAQYAADLM